MAQAKPDLAAQLRAARLATGQPLSITAVAAGVDPSHLSKIERGVVRPGLDVLYRLGCVLDLDDLTRALGPYVGEPAA